MPFGMRRHEQGQLQAVNCVVTWSHVSCTNGQSVHCKQSIIHAQACKARMCHAQAIKHAFCLFQQSCHISKAYFGGPVMRLLQLDVNLLAIGPSIADEVELCIHLEDHTIGLELLLHQGSRIPVFLSHDLSMLAKHRYLRPEACHALSQL